MSENPLLPVDRFLDTLTIVAREAMHLDWSRKRLFAQPIDTAWVAGLETDPELAERLEAFVSRYGRLQDTMADKLLPRWLLALAETPGSQIEVLNRAERLGVVDDVTSWLEARTLRNRLVHEYMTDRTAFAEDLNLAEGYCLMLMQTYGKVRRDAIVRMGVSEDRLPADPSAFTTGR